MAAPVDLRRKKNSMDHGFVKNMLLDALLKCYRSVEWSPEGILRYYACSYLPSEEIETAVSMCLKVNEVAVRDDYRTAFPSPDSVTKAAHSDELLKIKSIFLNAPFSYASFLEFFCRCTEYTVLAFSSNLECASDMGFTIVINTLQVLRETEKINEHFWKEFDEFCGTYVKERKVNSNSMDHGFVKNMLLDALLKYYRSVEWSREGILMYYAYSYLPSEEIETAVSMCLKVNEVAVRDDYRTAFPSPDSVTKAAHSDELLKIKSIFLNAPFSYASFLDFFCRCTEYTVLAFRSNVECASDMGFTIVINTLQVLRETEKINEDFWKEFDEYCGTYVKEGKVNSTSPSHARKSSVPSET